MFYTDRAQVSVGGTVINPAPVRVDYTEDQNVSAVDAMTPDHAVAGFVRGNTHYSITVTENISNSVALEPIEFIDYENQNIEILIQSASGSYAPAGGGGVPFDGNTFIFTNCVYQGQDVDYPGSGQVATRTSRFLAQYKVLLPPSSS